MFEIYVSTDVETDGPVAGKHSILSIGSAAYGRKGNAFDILRQLGNIAERASRFQDRCLVADAAGSVVGVQAEPRAPARCHGALCHLAQVASREAGLRRLSDRVRLSLRLLVSDRVRRGEPVWLFGNRHQNLFDGANAQAISHVREAVAMPAEWLDPVPHTHVALDDAIEQGRLFCNMLRANRAVG